MNVKCLWDHKTKLIETIDRGRTITVGDGKPIFFTEKVFECERCGEKFRNLEVDIGERTLVV